MLKLFIFFILFLFFSPKFTFQIDLGGNTNRNSNIYKNYDISILKKEYESIISDISINNIDYESDLTNILNQLNNLQFTNFTNFNSLEWYNSNNINSNNTLYTINDNNVSDNKVKVGIVVSSFEGMHSTSGIGTVYSILSEFLKEKGYDVTVIYTRDETPERKSFYEWKVDLKRRGINLVHLPNPTVRVDNPLFVRKSYQVYQYLKSQSFDILHFPDFEGMAYYCCLAKKNGLYFNSTSIVVGLHGPSVWVSKSNQNQKISLQNDQLELDFMERKSVEMADIIWTPSNYIVNWLITEAGWTIPQSNLYLLPFLPPKQTSLTTQKDSKSSSIKEFVFFGRLEKRKGLALFCDALDQLVDQHSNLFDDKPKIKVSFLGRSSTINSIDSIEYLKDRSLSWPFKVSFLTEMSSSEAIEYLSAGLDKVAVIPSLEDNAPYTLYECLYMGIPFIASSQSSMIPLINKDDQQEVLFSSRSSFSLMNKIFSILNSPDSSHKIVKPLFTKDKSEQTWLNFYKFIINQQEEKQKETGILFNDFKGNMTSGSGIAISEGEPLVSICIVHFNRPFYLKQALESIENQDYLNYEVILVDDGSSNQDALDYIKSLENKFKYNGWKIIQTENRYLGAARNAASKEANGKYLLFLDDDNYLYSNTISTYVKIATNTKSNVVTAAHSIFNSSLSPISEQVVIERQWVPLGPSLSVGLFKNCFGDANFFIEKKSFESIGGFTEEYGVGLEDHEILAKLVIEGYKLSVSTEPLLYYRMHDPENQMIFNTDSKSNQMRYIRPFSQVLSNGHVPVLKVLASNAVRHSSKLALNSQCNITLSSVQPRFGSPSGGTLITINGNGFNCGVTSVLLGGASCLNPKVKTDSILTCTTPESSSNGTADLSVKGHDGSVATLMEAFDYESKIAVKSCNLGATAEYLSCILTKPSNQAESSCYKIFSGNSLQLLGGGSSVKCEWTGPSILMVTYGGSPSVEMNSQLEFLGGGITSVDGDTNEFQTVTVQPAEEVSPKVILKAPRIIDACDPLVLDATHTTGDNGKPLTYVWSVSGGGADNNQELNQLLAKSVNKITIPNNLLSEGEYVFTLEAKNWLGYSDSSSVTVTKQNGPVLYVNIEGPPVIKTGTSDLSLIGNASLSGCSTKNDTASQTITYKWEISPEIVIKESALNNKVLNVPSSSWVYNTNYTVTLTATSGTVSNYATVTIIVGGIPVIANIKGGDKKFSLNKQITLDASSSIDPTNNVTSTDSFTYTWSCVVQRTNKDCGINPLPSDPIIEISTSSLGVGLYYFSVEVAPIDDPSRSGSATTSIEVTNKPFLDISIDKSLLPTYINPTEKLILRSIITGYTGNPSNLQYQWSKDQGTLEINPLSAAASTPLNGRNLVLKAGSLGPSCLYTFTITVTDKVSGEKGSASVTFKTEAAPTGGDIICHQTSGTVIDQYSIEMSKDWTSNTGIKGYVFRYRIGNTPEVSLGDKSEDNSIITYLPPGDITIIGYVYSGNDIPSTKECKIKVEKINDPERVINFLTGIMTNSSIDIYQLSVGVKIANSYLSSKPKSNSKLATEAEVVNRATQLKSSGVTMVLGKINQQETLSAYGISSIVDLICTSTDLSTVVHPKSLQDSMKVMEKVGPLMIKAPILQSDFALSASFLGNVDLQIKDQVTGINPDYVETAINVSSKILTVSYLLADGLLYRTIDGEEPISVSGNGLTITAFKALPHDFNSNGKEIGGEKGDPKFALPSGILSKHIQSLKGDAGVSAKYVSIPSNTHISHKTPKGSTLKPRTVSLSLYKDDNSPLSINNLKNPISINMGAIDNNNKEHKCAWWNENKLQWSTEGCSTEKKSGSIHCKCSHLTEFGILEFAKSSTNIWIIIGPVIGGVVFAALLVGTVVFIKKKKTKDNKKKGKKTKEELAKEKEDKKQQQREKKEQEKKAKEDKKKAKEDKKDDASSSKDEPHEKDSMEIPKTNKDKEFGDENDVQYILQEFKDIYGEAKKREQQKILKNQPISPVSSTGSSLSNNSTPATSTVPIPTESPEQSTFNPEKDKAARTIQKAWKNYNNIKQLRKEAELGPQFANQFNQFILLISTSNQMNQTLIKKLLKNKFKSKLLKEIKLF
ncbi:hypothetical protein DICPUDRAFT_87341 [Dictyostelium purpureum]|uniref:GAIN-B domain-containing protein n=1 Tax=Dictyostelium purpureum TaxID=5786 RepID=F0ZHG5_DICPU|nr:uncharacterized protein DICPUDRAFT_87341 [Dictyostelium purpureum]EGC36612.1 hypothetical protein DICPUDRAFT_87341 [Dictyostelium purpureum]|eukprot:XP_003286850.1 hypothetical protein DICPUDRAFT_87341 [Dictyostelium purpureum]